LYTYETLKLSINLISNLFNMQQIHIGIIILITLIASACSFSFPITNIPLKNSHAFVTIFQEQDSSNSKIKDAKDDAKLVALYKTIRVPEVQNYHDILSAEVNKINDNKILFTMELAGDANINENYETVYLWLIYIPTTNDNVASTGDKEFQIYTLIIPNFGANSNFGNKEAGWYLAVFNNTNNVYTLPLAKISDMPTNKVQVFIDPIFIGNPSNFNYTVSSMIRVNDTFLDKPPDYFVDFAPDDFTSFWKEWFR
jgi:hypothetical protein